MRIKSLKVSGFKSFCHSVDIKFQQNGITVVIGPNGCGKSSNQSYSSEPSQSMGSNQESSEATSESENSQTGEKEDYIKDDIPF